jgi:hypothetical protein
MPRNFPQQNWPVLLDNGNLFLEMANIRQPLFQRLALASWDSVVVTTVCHLARLPPGPPEERVH